MNSASCPLKGRQRTEVKAAKATGWLSGPFGNLERTAWAPWPGSGSLLRLPGSAPAPVLGLIHKGVFLFCDTLALSRASTRANRDSSSSILRKSRRAPGAFEDSGRRAVFDIRQQTATTFHGGKFPVPGARRSSSVWTGQNPRRPPPDDGRSTRRGQGQKAQMLQVF